MTSGDLSQETASVVVGIDVGTSGVRVIASDAGGTVCAVGESQLGCDRRIGDTIHEQNSDDWWLSLCQATKTTIRSLYSKGASIGIAGIAVTSTSGTLVVADISARPLRPAILYDDRRGAELSGRPSYGSIRFILFASQSSVDPTTGAACTENEKWVQMYPAFSQICAPTSP